MWSFGRNRTGRRRPPRELVAAAKKQPGGWVYEIDAEMVNDPDGEVPAHAIIGAWTVDDRGKLTGEFQHNPQYRGQNHH